MGSLANRIKQQPRIEVGGVWQRHTPQRYLAQALQGYTARGRWGTADGFSVLYLGAPRESVVIEAYRHLIDPVLDGTPPIAPRVLVTCDVAVTEILDLRTALSRYELLDESTLTSATNDQAAYARCQEVAAVAQQLGFHGLIAPAATRRGETLALFMDNLPTAEHPQLRDPELWSELPPDPRGGQRPNLRVVT